MELSFSWERLERLIRCHRCKKALGGDTGVSFGDWLYHGACVPPNIFHKLAQGTPPETQNRPSLTGARPDARRRLIFADFSKIQERLNLDEHRIELMAWCALTSQHYLVGTRSLTN